MEGALAAPRRTSLLERMPYKPDSQDQRFPFTDYRTMRGVKYILIPAATARAMDQHRPALNSLPSPSQTFKVWYSIVVLDVAGYGPFTMSSARSPH